MDAAKLVAAVIHGSSIKSDVSAVQAAKAAASASGSEAHWMGSSDEEKARILSWLQSDLSNEKLLIADLEKALESSSFAALAAHETVADIVLYSALASKVLPENLHQNNPNVARWLNHMQNFVGKATGSPALIKFRMAGLKATVTAAEPSSAAASAIVPGVAGDRKKDDKKDAKTEKKDDKAQAKEEKKHAKAEGSEGKKEAKADSGDVKVDAKTEATEAKKEAKASKAPKEEGAAKAEKEPKSKKPAATATGGEEGETFLPNELDVRVGKIISCKQFTEKLYQEEIDVGEGAPRIVMSGLVAYYASADMLTGKDVLVVCNLKPRKMADGESNGMVLAASNSDKTSVKLVEPPAGSKPGDHVAYIGAPPTPATFAEPNKVAKKKILEGVMAGWVTDAEGRVSWSDKEANKIFVMTVNGQPVMGGGIQSGTVG